MKTKYRFQGYNTKPNKLLGDGSIASDCNNVIINRGDLCNVPMSERKISTGAFIFNDENLIAFYFYKITDGNNGVNISAIVIFNDKGEVWITDNRFDSIRDNEQFINLVIADFGEIVKVRNPYKQTEDGVTQSVKLTTLSGNIIQVSDWLMFLCQTGIEIPSSLNPDTPKIYPQMFRIRFPKRTEHLATGSSYLRSLIGLYQPSAINFPSRANGGLVTGTGIDFGFSFVTEFYDGNVINSGVVAEVLESNVTILNTSTTYASEQLTFKVFLPYGQFSYWPHGVKYVYVYVKLQDQSIYYFWQRILIGSYPINIVGQKAYINVIVNSPVTQDLTRPAPVTSLTPIVGAHDPPKLATHGCYYKGKMYYNCLEFPNLLQISARTPAGQFDTGLYANYIEVWEFIGKETSQINGLIEFQGQVVVFQDVETYVVTDDLNNNGEIRILFHNLGCVKGGKAYITVFEKLVFGSKNGIYIFDGSSEPICISDAIQKDLEKISLIRYNFMRLSKDEEHKLLFVNFPLGFGCATAEVVPTFVFHYEEGGKWTKIDAISDTLNDKFCNQEPTKRFNILYNSRQSLRLIKSVDDPTAVFGTTPWNWTSSIFDLEDIERFKHWLWIRLGTIPALDLNFQIVVDFFDGEGNQVIGGGVGIDQLTVKKLRKISSNAKQLIIKLSGVTQKPFRLTEFELSGHTRTKR